MHTYFLNKFVCVKNGKFSSKKRKVSFLFSIYLISGHTAQLNKTVVHFNIPYIKIHVLCRISFVGQLVS